LKVTVPVAVPGVTVAVKTTLSPKLEALRPEAKVVALEDLATAVFEQPKTANTIAMARNPSMLCCVFKSHLRGISLTNSYANNEPPRRKRTGYFLKSAIVFYNRN
jgi:hypothetical protein